MVWEEGWCGRKDGVVGRMVWEEGWYGRKDGVGGRMVWEEGWCGRKDGVVGRMVWELLVRPNMEYAEEVWCTGGNGACWKLESSQMKMGRRLLGPSNTVAGVAVQGDLGWTKQEERREEMKVMFGKRLEVLEEARLVKTR